jgi:hypothetical protein
MVLEFDPLAQPLARHISMQKTTSRHRFMCRTPSV